MNVKQFKHDSCITLRDLIIHKDDSECRCTNVCLRRLLTLKLSLHGLVLAEKDRQKPPKFTCNESHDFRIHDACSICFCLYHLRAAFQKGFDMKCPTLKSPRIKNFLHDELRFKMHCDFTSKSFCNQKQFDKRSFFITPISN